jgi:hypothetical protein
MTIRPLTPLDTIILNGTVVTAADIGRYDIGTKDGKIAILAPAGSLADPPSPATRIIDAQGAYVMPGGVDAHVHLAEPQLFGKGKAADDYCTGIYPGDLFSVQRDVRANTHRHEIRNRWRHNNNNRLRPTRQTITVPHKSPRRDRRESREGRILRLLVPPPHRKPDA